jgi:hypothetical protein
MRAAAQDLAPKVKKKNPPKIHDAIVKKQYNLHDTIDKKR